MPGVSSRGAARRGFHQHCNDVNKHSRYITVRHRREKRLDTDLFTLISGGGLPSVVSEHEPEI